MPPSPPQAVLLVDGYNIIGNWSNLKAICDAEGMETARYALMEELVNYSALQCYKTQIVFDAHYQNTCSHQQDITEYLSVYYTNFGETADTYIEKVCAVFNRHYLQRLLPGESRKTLHLLVNGSASRLIVATSDRAQQLTVVGYGAEWMSAVQLNYEVKATLQRGKRNHKPRKQSPSRFLASSLDAKSRQRLSELRMGIK